jgi:cell shape-determining protein MreD
MTAIFVVVIWMVLILGQSVVLPLAFGLNYVYDLTIPIVVYLALFRSLREGGAIVLLLGIIMEGLSGGPFGIYMTTYYWVFALLKWLISLFNVQSNFLIPFVVAAGVALENAVVVLVMSLGGSDPATIAGVVNDMVIQVIWALPTGPVILLAIQSLVNTFERRLVSRITTSEL